jgi:Rrf2 family protein
MKMSDGVEWTLHCVTLLASLPLGALLSGRALAEFHEVSESYLAKHLKRVAAAGLVVSVPGPQGGYRFNSEADAASVLDVVPAVEGEGPSFRCTEIRHCEPAAVRDPAVYRLPCRIHAAMLAADRASRESLRAVRISELAAEVGASLDPRVLKKARVWLGENLRGEIQP